MSDDSWLADDAALDDLAVWFAGKVNDCGWDVSAPVEAAPLLAGLGGRGHADRWAVPLLCDAQVEQYRRLLRLIRDRRRADAAGAEVA